MELKYPNWQRPSGSLAGMEPGETRCPRRSRRNSNVFFGQHELSTNSDGHDEQKANADAAETLLVIKREMLGFPGLEFIDHKEDPAKTEPN
jgi:hypothetical protein